jgi:hypothetical protein
LRIETIWVSLNFDFFMEPPGSKDARKLYFSGVRNQGELTEPSPEQSTGAIDTAIAGCFSTAC